jgi:hypothetical protein
MKHPIRSKRSIDAFVYNVAGINIATKSKLRTKLKYGLDWEPGLYICKTLAVNGHFYQDLQISCNCKSESCRDTNNC